MIENRVVRRVHSGLRQRRVGEKNKPIARAAEGELQTGERQHDLTGLRFEAQLSAREVDGARGATIAQCRLKSPACKEAVVRRESGGVQGRRR